MLERSRKILHRPTPKSSKTENRHCFFPKCLWHEISQFYHKAAFMKDKWKKERRNIDFAEHVLRKILLISFEFFSVL